MTFRHLQVRFKCPVRIPTPFSLHPSHLPSHIWNAFVDIEMAFESPRFPLRAAQIYPNKLAIVHPDVEHPEYTTILSGVFMWNLAYGLIEAGIQPGDRIAYIAPNTPAVAEAYHGVIAAKAVVCPINMRLTHGEVAYILEHSGSKLIFVDHEYVGLVKGAKFLTAGRKFSAERGWGALNGNVTKTRLVRSVTPLERLVGPRACLQLSEASSSYHDLWDGVDIGLGSYLAAIANAYETKLNIPVGTSMFHASGWTFPWAITFAAAAQIGLFNAPQARRLNKPVYAVIAGSAPTAHLLGELEKINIQPVHVYGLTEVRTNTYGPLTKCYPQPSWASLSLQERAKLVARQGLSFATAEDARVTMGEVVFRGNIVMREYFRDPAATRRAFRGGYFHSGDLAVWHPDGYIAVMDRSKDIIISGGENASSLAIEQELSTHPDVLEVSVVARAHPKWGERPMAFVLLHPGRADKWRGREAEFERDLKAHARKTLPGFACPEWVSVVEQLPKTSTGKIQKVELRKLVAKL
ncbi:acetyl-CoA synthetase-like protein [Epithele typhae]|uniref:acetyl-CoA synthetase-like protein n=1 Tax=Epithele typhae TaxID=378194 RepID=UPI002007CD7D|nr:acetyl-CoA synthetase-like protein [Epithele typhae]KAH9928516.1 acetyl-CoA synthetase-like protein [Epithele typhae]